MKPSSSYRIAPTLLAELSRLSPWRSFAALASVWAAILALVLAMRQLEGPDFWIAYLPVVFLIAGRQGALLQLVHEAAHHLLCKVPRHNRVIGRWLCGYPIGVFFHGFARVHFRHHAHVGTRWESASDREKHRVTELSPRLALFFLKDLLGLTALGIFQRYEKDERRPTILSRRPMVRHLLQLCLVQSLLFGLLFRGDLFAYLTLWVYPAMGPHMFLMRIRGIAEHGLARQRGEAPLPSRELGMRYTRTFLSPSCGYAFAPFRWIEKALIGSLQVHYHHEHHAFPNIPFYRLPSLHEAIHDQVEETGLPIYEKGYLSAFLACPKNDSPHPHPLLPLKVRPHLPLSSSNRV